MLHRFLSKLGRARKWILLLATMAALYLGGSTFAHRNYWAGLFWGAYLDWLPAYDVIDGPRQSVQNRLQYRAAVKFIQPRLISPTTATFCSFSESTFGVDRETEQRAMLGYVDSQNAFGAMIRSHFQASFEAGEPTQLYSIRWLTESGQVWRNTAR